MPRFIPRTIRGQLIWGTALLQCLLVASVFGYIYHNERTALRHRVAERLTYEAQVLSGDSAVALKDGNTADLQSVLDLAVTTPTIRAARITGLSGNTLAYSNEAGKVTYPPLSAAERRQLGSHLGPTIFENDDHRVMAVQEIDVNKAPVALAWIYPDTSEDQVDMSSLLRSALLFALLAIFANALFSMLLARSVTRPLRGLLRGTKLLIRDPERSGVFPLKTSSVNEAGELTRAFNTMVAALNEQRSGLNDTLALLDSMLANAPIGFAFFDRKARYVRVNQFLAEMDNLSINRHLGRTVREVSPGETAQQLGGAIEQVFSTGMPVRELELRFELPSLPENPRIWLVSLYPVRTGGDESVVDRPADYRADPAGEASPSARQFDLNDPDLSPVRWVGAVIVDVTDRRISEELLRRTEKLAATGRLAASIAHEINNPLEGVTNLLYLLHQQPLDPEALQYADMAQQEIARVSQITQQTLRFYRQSSKPVLTNPGELLDSVLDLHQGRIAALQIEIDRRYRPGADFLAFGGEMRQLFANFIGNALDALSKGGHLVLSVRPSQAWSERTDGQPSAEPPAIPGVRIVIADTGSGMSPAVRKRIFDAFFTTKEATGTGLGLWISSEIIAKHHGTVRVRSRSADAPGPGSRGAVFMLFFPFAGPASEANASGADQQPRIAVEA